RRGDERRSHRPPADDYPVPAVDGALPGGAPRHRPLRNAAGDDSGCKAVEASRPGVDRRRLAQNPSQLLDFLERGRTGVALLQVARQAQHPAAVELSVDEGAEIVSVRVTAERHDVYPSRSDDPLSAPRRLTRARASLDLTVPTAMPSD